MWQLSQLQIIDQLYLEREKEKEKREKIKRTISLLAGRRTPCQFPLSLSPVLSEHFRGLESILFVKAERRQNRASQKYFLKL